MKHRKLTRVLTLTAACAVSLCAGAYLSYQAATLEESGRVQTAGVEQAAGVEQTAGAEQAAGAEQVAQGGPVQVEQAGSAPQADADSVVAAGAGSQIVAAANIPPDDAAKRDATPENTPSDLVKVNLPVSHEPLAASATAGAPLGMRGGEEAVRETAPADSAPAAQSDRFANLEIIPTPTDEFEQSPGKSVPLPPRRPSGLSGSVAPVATETGSAPAEVSVAAVSPPVAPSAPAPVASVAPPAPVAAAPQPAPAPRQVAAIQPPQASPSPASPDAFPSIASALAAVTASVGAAPTPLPPGEATAPSAMGGGFKKGSPVYVRIFKQEGTLELWIKRGESYALYKSFPVCKMSGQLGPKTRTADYQSPEGFYSVSARQLNPHSAYHLAFDVGYPNAFDRRQGSTGSAVMVHGDCKSIGCFAMTNDGIDEIYGIVAAALEGGQREVPVHIFPFRMSETAIARESAPKAGNVLAFLAPAESAAPRRDWSPFWRNLKQGYDLFERSHVPPVAFACGDRYEFGAAGRSCARIAGW